MATIYRFIVEGGTGRGGSGGRKGGGKSKKITAKKGKWENWSKLGQKGGVEHNRKMRAVNPLINRATGGWWEKSTRVGRAMGGIVQKNSEAGKLRIGGTAVSIIVAFAIKMFLDFHNAEIQRNKEINTRNYRAIENGVSRVHNVQDITTNWFNGRINYNNNK